jgi:hypothetical protein
MKDSLSRPTNIRQTAEVGLCRDGVGYLDLSKDRLELNPDYLRVFSDWPASGIFA